MAKFISTLLKLAAKGLVNSRRQAAQLLGIQPNATLDEINKAYKAKAIRFHPDLHPEKTSDMKMINSAREFMITYYGLPDPEPELEMFQEPEPESEDTHDPSQMSYEDIRDIRNEMGREEFNRQYPGWESELRSEMGQEAYNAMFEGYSEAYEPEYGGDYEHAVENAWEYLLENAESVFSDYLDNLTDAMEKEFYEDNRGFSSAEEYVYETLSEWLKHRSSPPSDKNEEDKSLSDIALEQIIKLNNEQKRIKFNSSELKRIVIDAWEKALVHQVRLYRHSVDKNRVALRDLANTFISKYAKSEDLQCKCEHAQCKATGMHEPSKCRNKSSGKGCMYLGPICDACAEFMDPQYLLDMNK
jgi:hypothetical protein